MFAEPLVQKSKIIKSAGDPVGFEQEIKYLYEFLKTPNKEIDLEIQVANLDNLEKSLSLKTDILHIICHGDFSQQEQKYYLSFENENSELDTITNLILGKTIQQAFESASLTLKSKLHDNCYTCCCAHKHSNDCEWQQYAMDNGYTKAHLLHQQLMELRLFGRNEEIYQVYKALNKLDQEHRIVVVYGNKGSGRTALASKCARTTTFD
ncbi:hypothetical protein IMG5_066230 [Ichthyophthirius multifiliis]|uniref:CHAT domain-containing protein n=1 Tax=Ichthyophthirius multifiliis TaxID=5932 RepID=G0QPC2_ICHMU|nr:hypothetical protein IMG5_066230 [Ichthyophthirius multifiliis]EGR32937.1 hypothetical protein IMG5_066230 [Ichthyophthirius multifiliis]|eukprot:XP_004036923.1 hypothetical protein IMG5_066230 [Ichthyophthirius multifiliis]